MTYFIHGNIIVAFLLTMLALLGGSTPNALR